VDDQSRKSSWRLNLDVIRADFRKMSAWPFTSLTQTPTLLLSGKRANYVSPVYLQAMHQYFPNTRHVSLECGHWVHAERPREFVENVADFLSNRE